MKTHFVFSLKTKFVLAAAMIVATTSFTGGSWFLRQQEQVMTEKLQSGGRLVLSSVKVPVINTIINEELGSRDPTGFLDDILADIMANPQFTTEYAFIIDADGKVIAHNRMKEYGKIYHDPFTMAALAGDDYRMVTLPGTNGSAPVLHMALPLKIYGKSWGVLQVGFSLAPLQAKLKAMKRTIWWFSLCFFLIGTSIFYLIGRTMTQPLQHLSLAMAEITHEAMATAPSGQRRDEIGLLQRSFNAMIERLKQSEMERHKAIASLVQSEKLAMTGKLVAGVAHEVNNPLAAIATCLYNLEQKVSEEMRWDLDIVKQGFNRIGTIVKQLSDLSSAARLDLHPVASDLFFQEAISFARMALKKHPVTLSAADGCVPQIFIPMDRGKIHQVMLNLLVNAADASPPDGSIHFATFVADDRFCFSITDQGSGISGHHREKIFELFYSTKGAGSGSGIGLAICKAIIDMHQGSIEFESGPSGTVFTIAIPLHKG